MIISVTEEESNYLRCRRQWHYASPNRMGLAPIINAPALSLGTLIHQTLEGWRNDPKANPVTIYDGLCLMEKATVIQTYKEQHGYEPSDIELQPTEEAMHVGHFMIENYKTVWRTPLPDGFTLISNEQTIIVPIPGTEHCECQPPYECSCCAGATDCCNITMCAHHGCKVECHQLEGTLDWLGYDEVNDRLVFSDVKTYKKTPNAHELSRKRQFTGYCWLLQQNGTQTRHCLYDGLNKRVDAVRGHPLEYNFLRLTVPRTQAAIDNYGLSLAKTVMEMANPDLPIYPQIPFMGCWDCNFEQLCDAETNGEDLDPYLSQYVKKGSKLYERYTELWNDE